MLDLLSEELEYVALLAQKYTRSTHQYDDQDGSPVWGINAPQTIATFISRVEQQQIKPRFTKKQYLSNADIIGTIEGYKMDVEKFWYALLFIYDYVQKMCDNRIGGHNKPSIAKQLILLRDYLTEHPTAEITVKHSGATRKTMLELGCDAFFGNNLNEAINRYLLYVEQILETESGEEIDFFKVGFFADQLDLDVPTSEKESVKIGLAAKMYLTLFDEIKLPNMRNVYTKEPISFDRKLLISRIVFIYGYTFTNSYLTDKSALKQALKASEGKHISVPLSSSY